MLEGKGIKINNKLIEFRKFFFFDFLKKFLKKKGKKILFHSFL